MQKEFSSGNKTVDKLYNVNFSGNIVPVNWYKTIVNQNGKPQLTAISILSDIVYWYRPTVERDEKTGIEIGLRKKFSDDLLQRSYEQMSSFFGISKRVAKNNTVFLEELGVIRREFRNIVRNGQVINNVLYIDLNIEKLFEVTFKSDTDPMPKNGHRSNKKKIEVQQKKGIAMTKNGHTNTEITTITTSNITSINHNHSLNFDEESFKNQINYIELMNSNDRTIIYITDTLLEVMKQEKGHYHINNIMRDYLEVQKTFIKTTATHIENVARDVSNINSEIKNRRNYIISALFNEIQSNHLNKKSTSRKGYKQVETLPDWAQDGYEYKEEVMSEERKRELEKFKFEGLKAIRGKSKQKERAGVESGF
ncbi:hypothetical protein [Enterococcus hirae]|uniref:hypothetical protein n=1 Tax=Enterococcus hirae TaxID=1354 RepID=UPI001E3C55A0|nr:hypothetical protein [Enterococcus hirae]MCD5088518.1 hypothetical protein [Enterococcus hirae]UYT95856.1 hypothetical protein OKL54_02715 [Enterococcus hirae]UYT97395.1 hypothetical protein OKL53_10510 [Enterococcus hirae]UYU00909.1 hypothetical protein OKL58_02725 [Enterococcus hirae]